MVYVDAPIWEYRGMLMCLMAADTIEELHTMADTIGVNRQWFQSGKRPHYDICKTKRRLAIRSGAVEVGSRELIRILAASK